MFNKTLLFSMSSSDVRNLKVRLGEYNIKQSGETTIWESKAARVVRHKEFSQQTLVIHCMTFIQHTMIMSCIEFILYIALYNLVIFV